MNPSASRLAAALLAGAVLLAACGGGNGDSTGQTVPPPQPPQSLGLMKITISGLGTNSMSSHAELLSAPAGGGLQPRALNAMPSGIDVKQIATSHVDVGTRGAGGMRYFNAVYSVRNAQFCNTPGSCAAYTVPHQNLTFIAASISGNIDGTAVNLLNRFDGSVDTASIAQDVLPSHGVILNGDGTGVLVQPGYESMQVYSEEEIAGIPLDTGATGLFPYGYVVKNIHSGSSRTLPGSPAVDQYDGQLAFSFKVPLQTAETDDPYSVVLIFQVVEDTNTRVTQSAEEQTYAGDAVATARAAALGSTDLVVLGGRVAETDISDPVCSVRTAGTVDAPQAWLVDNGNTPTLAGAPYNLQFLAPGGSVNAGFCTAMNDAGFSTFVISGSQSGTRTAGGTYTGSYAGGGSNRLSFTPDSSHPFFPGELVSFTATTGLSSSAGSLPLSQAFVGSFLAGGVVASSGTFGTAQNPGVGNNPTSVAIGDFDGDGHPDLAVANYSDNTVSILLHSGVAVTPLAVGAPGSAGAFSIVTADFNGDGHLDLAVADQQGNDVAIFLGNGSGGFTAATIVNVGNSPESIVVGDFNGDGKPDLAVANTGDNRLSILINNGSGFSLGALPFTGTSPFAIAAGDFNGDGKLDLAVANGGDSTVLILFGTGSGGFNAGGTFSAGAGSTPDSIAVGDFDNDGVLDLAVGDSADGLVVIMTGPGDGTLPNRATYSVGSGPSSNPYYVAAGDFNGDGKLDLAVANNADGTVSVLLANGSGFQAPVNYAVGSTTSPSPYSVYTGDLDGDGRLDLVVANFAETDISVLLGQP